MYYYINMIHLRPFFIDTEYGKYKISYHYGQFSGTVIQVFLNFPDSKDKKAPDEAKFGYILIENNKGSSNSTFSIYSAAQNMSTVVQCKDLLHLYMLIADVGILVSAEAIDILIKEAAKHGLKTN